MARIGAWFKKVGKAACRIGKKAGSFGKKIVKYIPQVLGVVGNVSESLPVDNFKDMIGQVLSIASGIYEQAIDKYGQVKAAIPDNVKQAVKCYISNV